MISFCGFRVLIELHSSTKPLSRYCAEWSNLHRNMHPYILCFSNNVSTSKLKTRYILTHVDTYGPGPASNPNHFPVHNSHDIESLKHQIQYSTTYSMSPIYSQHDRSLGSEKPFRPRLLTLTLSQCCPALIVSCSAALMHI